MHEGKSIHTDIHTYIRTYMCVMIGAWNRGCGGLEVWEAGEALGNSAVTPLACLPKGVMRLVIGFSLGACPWPNGRKKSFPKLFMAVGQQWGQVERLRP